VGDGGRRRLGPGSLEERIGKAADSRISPYILFYFIFCIVLLRVLNFLVYSLLPHGSKDTTAFCI
jgi:hypothetical protein